MNKFVSASRFLFLLLVCLLTFNASRTAQAEELRFKFKKGEKFKIKIEQTVSTKQSVGGFDAETPMKMTSDISWVIEEVNQDSYRIAQTIDRMQMSLKIPVIGEIKFDSDNDANEGIAAEMATAMKPLIGVKIVQDMDSRGQVSNVKIPEKALKDLAANPLLKQMFNEDSLKQMFGQSSVVLPEKEVKKGDAWKSDMQVKSPLGLMKINNEYQYDGRDNQGLDKLLVKTTTAIEENADSPLPMKINIKDQDTSGFIMFDNKLGRLTSSEIKQKMVMTVTVNGQEINQTINSKTAMTFAPAK